MINQILDLAVSNGLWATLFVGLLFYILKDTSNREKKYQATITSLSNHLSVVKDIQEEVKEINAKVKPAKTKGANSNEVKLKEQNI